MRGSAHNDNFKGGDDNDRVSGSRRKGQSTTAAKAGTRSTSRANDFNNGLHGANVDLAKSSGQVIDDGYGNTETAKKFEEIVGTKFADTLQGNDGDNTIKGQDGNDFMAGRGGADTFVFNADPNSASNHDTIGDFNAAEGDLIALRDGAFPALTTGCRQSACRRRVHRQCRRHADQRQSAHRLQDTPTGNLFYDPDGNTQFRGQGSDCDPDRQPALTAAAFEIWS